VNNQDSSSSLQTELDVLNELVFKIATVVQDYTEYLTQVRSSDNNQNSTSCSEFYQLMRREARDNYSNYLQYLLNKTKNQVTKIRKKA
jgi:uncharacterized short protein YbdD (DUF466 family)